MPTVQTSPSIRTHSCSFVYLRSLIHLSPLLARSPAIVVLHHERQLADRDWQRLAAHLRRQRRARLGEGSFPITHGDRPSDGRPETAAGYTSDRPPVTVGRVTSGGF